MKSARVLCSLLLGMSLVSPMTLASSNCTMEYALMVHPETGDCIPAENGCEIDELLSQGYRRSESCEHPSGVHVEGKISEGAREDSSEVDLWWEREPSVLDWE